MIDKSVSTVYPFYQVQNFDKITTTSIAPNASVTIAGDSIQVNTIPSRIIAVIETNKDAITNVQTRLTTTETFFNISNVQIKIGSNGTKLNGMTEQQLWKMSQANGYEASWNEWSGVVNYWAGTNSITKGLTGSVLVIEPGKDLTFGKDFAPGLQTNTQIQMSVTGKNINQVDSLVPRLRLIFIYAGTCTVTPHENSESTVKAKFGVYSVDDLKKINEQKDYASIPYSSVKDVYGGELDKGSIFGTLKSLFHTGSPLLKSLLNLIPVVGPALGMVPDVVEGLIGNGKKKGGMIVGGKRISKKDLLKGLM
jgi:hypothetical protein